MDPAVGLVQAYLRSNGYFTITEVPVVHRVAPNDFRSLTDIDVLAVRFPGAKRYIPGDDKSNFELLLAMDDPALKHEGEQIEIIIAEVKEGRAELNRGATDPNVMRAALLRFGINDDQEMNGLIDDLRHHGEAISTAGYRVRLFAFGTYPGHRSSRYKIILLRHIFDYFSRQADDMPDMINATQFKDPALGLLVLATKSGLRTHDMKRTKPRKEH